MKNLISSIKSKDLAGVAAAMSNINDINEMFQGETALTTAAAVGDLDIIKALLDAGSKLNVSNSKSKLPVDIAMSNGKMDAWVYLNQITSSIPKVDEIDANVETDVIGAPINDKEIKALLRLVAQAKLNRSVLSIDSNLIKLIELIDKKSFSEEDDNIFKGLFNNKNAVSEIINSYEKNMSLAVVLLSFKYGVDVDLSMANSWTLDQALKGLLLMINDKNKDEIINRIKSISNESNQAAIILTMNLYNDNDYDVQDKITAKDLEDIASNLNQKNFEFFSNFFINQYFVHFNDDQRKETQKIIDQIAKREVNFHLFGVSNYSIVDQYISNKYFRNNFNKLGLDKITDLPFTAISQGITSDFKTLVTKYGLEPKIDYKTIAEMTIGLSFGIDHLSMYSDFNKKISQYRNYTERLEVLESLKEVGFNLSNVDFESAYKKAHSSLNSDIKKSSKDTYNEIKKMTQDFQSIRLCLVYGKDHGFEVDGSDLVNSFSIWNNKIQKAYEYSSNSLKESIQLSTQLKLVANILLDKNAINVKNSEGLTPLMIAARSANSHMISALFNHGADVNLTDNKGLNALAHLSASKKKTEKDESIKVFSEYLKNKPNSPKPKM